MTGTILIIDDEEQLRKLLARIIGLEKFQVEEAGTLKTAFDCLTKKQIDVVLCDVKLPDGNGVEFLKEAKRKYPLTEFILLTAYGNIQDGVLAMKNGAFDYITKGDENDKIIPLVYRAVEKVQLQRKVEQLQKQLSNKFSFDSIIGNSTVIQNAIMLAKKVAETDTTVLLLGETGTGKEVFAQAIHNNSSRNGRSFISLERN